VTFPVILGAMVSGEPAEPDQREGELSPGSSDQGEGSKELRGVPADIQEVSFSVSVRGYDRRAVDAYVARVNRLIAEREVTRSPEAAVRHALEQVGEQTSGILQRAGETAEEIAVGARQKAEESTARAREEAEEAVAKATAKADEILSRSKAEAEAMLAQSRKEAADRLQRSEEEIAALREEAEARMRELHADTKAIREQRRLLLDDIRELAARVEKAASAADARFPPRETAESAQEELLETEPEAGAEQSGVTEEEPHNGTASRKVRPGR
jgi:DivIVA domain-containing protein